jgi:putative hydrolase of the HAD superfamily
VPNFVIFDLFHTLVHGADEARDGVVAEMGTIVGVEPRALVQAYNDTWRQRLTMWNVEQTIRILAGRLGCSLSDDQVARAARLRRDLAARVLESVRPTTVGVLDALRDTGWRLGLVSNATAETAEAWRDSRLAGFFAAVVFSCDLGLAKPDREIYLAATEALGATPVECVYVGDGADGELAGAAALGMTVIRTTEYSDTDPAWLGPNIAALADLRHLLAPTKEPQHKPVVGPEPWPAG